MLAQERKENEHLEVALLRRPGIDHVDVAIFSDVLQDADVVVDGDEFRQRIGVDQLPGAALGQDVGRRQTGQADVLDLLAAVHQSVRFADLEVPERPAWSNLVSCNTNHWLDLQKIPVELQPLQFVQRGGQFHAEVVDEEDDVVFEDEHLLQVPIDHLATRESNKRNERHKRPAHRRRWDTPLSRCRSG